jgi:hypothetical protein
MRKPISTLAILFAVCVLALPGIATADTTITSMGFYNGGLSGGAFTPTFIGEDTILHNCCAVLGISNADPATKVQANPFYNNADGSITSLPFGTYWGWFAEPYWGYFPGISAGPVAEVVVGLSDGNSLVSFFQIGSWSSPEDWSRLGGSDLISLASTGITDQDKLRLGDPGTPNFFWLQSDTRSDSVLQVQITQPVPEPASMVLVASGVVGLIGRRGRQGKVLFRG